MTHVVNENGQDHAMLGNACRVDQGVPIITHEDVLAEITYNAHMSLEAARPEWIRCGATPRGIWTTCGAG